MRAQQKEVVSNQMVQDQVHTLHHTLCYTHTSTSHCSLLLQAHHFPYTAIQYLSVASPSLPLYSHSISVCCKPVTSPIQPFNICLFSLVASPSLPLYSHSISVCSLLLQARHFPYTAIQYLSVLSCCKPVTSPIQPFNICLFSLVASPSLPLYSHSISVCSLLLQACHFPYTAIQYLSVLSCCKSVTSPIQPFNICLFSLAASLSLLHSHSISVCCKPVTSPTPLNICLFSLAASLSLLHSHSISVCCKPVTSPTPFNICLLQVCHFYTAIQYLPVASLSLPLHHSISACCKSVTSIQSFNICLSQVCHFLYTAIQSLSVLSCCKECHFYIALYIKLLLLFQGMSPLHSPLHRVVALVPRNVTST